MNYKLVVGLEMHCEMKSNSKVFSPASNIYNKVANANVNEICLGLPGILPNVNEECVRKAIMASLILGCEVPQYLMFDRKNYYYPDLPKGYQITQATMPIGTKGSIDIECQGKIIPISIQDIHLEEDSAALDHLDSISLIDYNRAGVPLLECVTDPCMHSAEEAVAFLDTMCRIYQYTDISDADTKKGQIRCDVNVSLQDENGNFITPKVEVKNVNSLGNVRDTILYEEKRQWELYLQGKTDELIQETRRFDEETGTTIHMRSKVDAIDYKYFVEPNIPPIKIDDEYVKSIKKQIPMLALERKMLYINKYGLDEVDANIIVKDIKNADYFEACINLGIDAKIASNWLNGLIVAYINKEEMSLDDFYLRPNLLKQIIDKLNDNTISSKQAKEIFFKSLEERKEPKEFISKENSQITDVKIIEDIIDNILANNESQIVEYQNGRTNVFDFFVGQVMKATKGKANPVITKELLHQKIDK
ncbi:MAG: Asp-tRNA(Asn)/Glu-tRNA(Gln) amidotransferase subunit GatB [Firmicutes bacterium]|nr:Asp-tRNA(Asn)/Glu-tRNA(Gln) amidotransferase subunit GatB [Bacillota bacterium]